MELTRRQVLAAVPAVPVAAALSADVQAQGFPDSNSSITNGVSGFKILTNSDDDFSVKVISGDGSKDVTWIRFKGPTAFADAVRHRDLLKNLAEVMGLVVTVINP